MLWDNEQCFSPESLGSSPSSQFSLTSSEHMDISTGISSLRQLDVVLWFWCKDVQTAWAGGKQKLLLTGHPMQAPSPCLLPEEGQDFHLSTEPLEPDPTARPLLRRKQSERQTSMQMLFSCHSVSTIWMMSAFWCTPRFNQNMLGNSMALSRQQTMTPR